MKISKILLALLIAGSFSQKVRAAEDDPARLMPKSYRVALDNREVRVLDIWLRPGQKTPMHSHPSSVLLVEQGGTLRFWDENGKSTTGRFRSGQILYRNAEDHMVQNLSRHTVHVRQVELKGVRFF